MKWYCEKCKKIHTENELCPRIRTQLKAHPELLSEAVNFISVAGEEALITSQALDNVAHSVNNLIGTNLSYEGTQQFARDIQVFKRLSEEPFSRSGVFASPENAKAYLENVLEVAKDNPRALSSFESKLTGYAQEVDWLRLKQGEFASIFQKSTLLNKNAPGIDGITINRFTGKEICRTTIKASKDRMTATNTGISDIKEALEKGTLTEKDVIFGPIGTEEAAREAGLHNPVIEKNTTDQILQSNNRLTKKILNGQATTTPSINQIGEKMYNGAIVGAVIELTLSGITSYFRYKNGELTREEAFKEIGSGALKGSLCGAAMGGITIFLPGGLVGAVAGMAIGIYVRQVCTNVLDEIMGEGAFGNVI